MYELEQSRQSLIDAILNLENSNIPFDEKDAIISDLYTIIDEIAEVLDELDDE